MNWLGWTVVIFQIFLYQARCFGEPVFKEDSTTVTAVPGSDAVLPCVVDSLGKYKIVWKDPSTGTLLAYTDIVIVEDSRLSVLRSNLDDWSLQIANVRDTDEGEYTCAINTSPIMAKPVRLIVLTSTGNTASPTKSTFKTIITGKSARATSTTSMATVRTKSMGTAKTMATSAAPTEIKTTTAKEAVTNISSTTRRREGTQTDGNRNASSYIISPCWMTAIVLLLTFRLVHFH